MQMIRYFQMSRLLQKINLSQADGYLPNFLNSLAKAHLLVIDDWLRSSLSKTQTNDLLEIIDETFGNRINFHPHLHFLVTEGGVDETGIFHKIPRIDDARLAWISTDNYSPKSRGV
jgi:hypothetical protein